MAGAGGQGRHPAGLNAISRFARHRDYFAGALVALIGAGAVAEGRRYGIGSLSAIGSGFFPVALGAGLIGLGALMAATSQPATAAAAAPDWRGAAAITAAVALFIALADTAGLAPAIFACVFLAALGTRATTLPEAAVLAFGMTLFGVLLFSFGLKLQFPIIRGLRP